MSIDRTHVTDAEVIDEFTPEEARLHTTKINNAVGVAGLLVVEAWERRIWTSLGYKSWPDYCDAELAISEQNPTSRAALMVGLRKAGASYRAVSAATGQSVGKVHKDLAGVHPVNTSTGLDGKNYAPTQPERPATDRAGEAESGDGSESSSPLPPSPAQPSSDDGGVSVSESVEADLPVDSIPAPSSDTLEEPAGDSLTGEGEDRAVPPSPEQRSKDLAEVGRRLKQVSEFFSIWSPAELHELNDLHTTESVRLVFEVISPWWQEYKQTQPRGLRVVNGEQP